MQPSRKEIFLFLLGNHAAYRSYERNMLTRYIHEVNKTEAPKLHWALRAIMLCMLGLPIFFLGLGIISKSMLFLLIFAYGTLPLWVVSLPFLIITTIKYFEVFFKNHPEDFPRP